MFLFVKMVGNGQNLFPGDPPGPISGQSSEINKIGFQGNSWGSPGLVWWARSGNVQNRTSGVPWGELACNVANDQNRGPGDLLGTSWGHLAGQARKWPKSESWGPSGDLLGSFGGPESWGDPGDHFPGRKSTVNYGGPL